MKKGIKTALFCLLLGIFVWGGTVLSDRQQLNDGLIRFHVVANSDSSADQEWKLLVRDAVTRQLEAAMADMADAKQAEAYLRENLSQIRELANETLQAAGSGCQAEVTLTEEEFDTRVYDTFTLPAGVYTSLRITIGEGEGKNWWCVVFPTLCLSATGEDFEAAAAASGFPDSLAQTLAGEEGYEIRFYLLDALGRLENLLHKG